MFSAENKTDCILWYQDSKSLKKVQVKFREKYGRNAKAPPHWAIAVRDWLNSNLQQRWIVRGGVEENNIYWPARSHYLTPMYFFLREFIKSMAYVKD